MQISKPNLSLYPESWNIDFVNQKTNFYQSKKQSKGYIISYLAELLFFPAILLLFYSALYFKFLIYASFIWIALYIFSPKVRFYFRIIFAMQLVEVDEIKRVKITKLKDKKFKFYFKNYYLDCMRFGDFVDNLSYVKCYPIFQNSTIFIVEFLFKEVPKSGYMLLKYY